MEAMVKKYQQKFRKVKEEMQRWEELQSRLISQFSNASPIIQRLQMIEDKKHYGILRDVDGVEQAVLRKQLESLETVMLSINMTMKDFRGMVILLEKMVRDGRQIAKGGSQLSAKQLNQRVGVKPSLSDCLDGLTILHEMHNSEYLLKTSVVSALSKIALKPSVTDLGTLCQLLVDQPNILTDEDGIPMLIGFSMKNWNHCQSNLMWADPDIDNFNPECAVRRG
ncbi:hypothetical protein Cgig2_032086 [Carnegiea gigantea]|uniref:Uncharacterized protein n=1 Tax=Carnegiea gigantea TaxID=171969 RepID=A0A9Q1Q6D0_9CARY|nr:hypothetical protein Cgig2_032086 [Carnegiea gigantea]